MAIQHLFAPNKSIDKSYSDIVEDLKNHLQLRSSEVVQRDKFYTRAKKTDEPVVNFVGDLKRSSENFNFGATLEIIIQRKFVRGIKEENT